MSNISVTNSPVAKIFFNEDFISNIYPNKVTSVLDEAEPFYYQLKPEIQVVGEQCFDTSTNILSLNIVFPRPEPQSVIAAKREIREFYDESNRNLGDIVLSPLEIAAYDLWLSIPGIPNLEVASGSRQDGPYGFTPIRIRKQITDEQVISFLTHHPESVLVLMRPFYLFETTDASSVFMQSTDKASLKAFERVFGKNPEESYVVNRRALQTLQESYKNEIHIEFRNIDPDNSIHTQAFEEIFNLLDHLEPITPEQLANSQDNIIIYGVGEAKTEISPVEYGDMVTSLERSDKIQQSFEEVWDNVASMAESSSSSENLYESMQEYVREDQSRHGKGTVGIKMIGVSQSLNFDTSFERDYGELSVEERASFDQFRSNMRDAGSRKQEFLNESYEHWTGKDYEEGQIIRSLNLFRVSKAMISRSLTATAEIFEELGEEAVIGPELQFCLLEDNTLTAGARAADRLRDKRNNLIQGASARVWQRYSVEIIAAVAEYSGRPNNPQAQARALAQFTTQFQAVLWAGIQQVILACRFGRDLNIPARMPQIGYCKPAWFRLAFVFIKNHHGLDGEEAVIANAYLSQMIAAWH